MSLSSFLLGGKNTSNKKVIDTELDALFQTQVQNNGSTAASNDKKRKPEEEQEHDLKKSKSARKESQRHDSPPPKRVKLRENKKEKVDKRKLEAQEKLKAISAVESTNVESRGAEPIDNSEEESGPSTLVHESLLSGGAKSNQRASARKVKFTPPDESEEQRNSRTIFVGNLSSEVAKKRPLQKQLHRHILSLVPTAKIESTRFRSVAFQNPTSKLPDDDGKEQTGSRQHVRDRASSWRKTNPTADEPKNDEKKFLTPSQKKKVAFINRELHPSADSVNAYVVFAYPTPAKERPSNLPPLPPVMDPHEAACLAVETCNGTVFMDRTIRVDSLGRPADSVGKQSALLGTFAGDPKSSIFVGNLDFASKEEDLRAFFESLITAERGPPSQASDAPKHWVSRVRIVRDKDTQLGKGFAYVQFTDRVCVDETLAMEESKLKFAKRKLRVQRCKVLPKSSATDKAAASKTTSTGAAPSPSIDVPKGDPSLGEKIATLSKEERKQIKAADADRLARRMAKKKARMALAKQGVPVRGKEKDGVRTRKTDAVKKAAIAPRKQSRIRSEKSVLKRNMKK
ncbi:hypothetical protein BDR04DRAFT_1103272 [Suillus decipiens]|nr:hypothetical protein BDR04DRAFT_1103272 [Suillus decipiens]